jgi:RNA 3'-terminal phosphate cyclase (ATP)
MIEIDGSQGEGGGQVLRTSLALAILTTQPVHLHHIRAGRSKPGLRPQHLTAVEAAGVICNAKFDGNQLGSSELYFFPGQVRPGRYKVKITTAGAATLVLQTIFIPLALAHSSSTITIGGGTHVPWSPSYHYLEQQWLPFIQRSGYRARLTLNIAGYYPEGGGEFHAMIRPIQALAPLRIVERGPLQRIRGDSFVSNLDLAIARRQKLQALRRLQPICRDTRIKAADLPAHNKGTSILLKAKFTYSQCCSSALGKKGKRAELVADEAARAIQSCLTTTGVVDAHLADQLLLPLAVIGQMSEFTTTCITHHLLTNAEVIQTFMPIKIDIQGELGGPGLVRIQP